MSILVQVRHVDTSVLSTFVFWIFCVDSCSFKPCFLFFDSFVVFHQTCYYPHPRESFLFALFRHLYFSYMLFIFLIYASCTFSFSFFSNSPVNVSRWQRLWLRLTSPPSLLLLLRGVLPLRPQFRPPSVGLSPLIVRSSATTASSPGILLRNALHAQPPLLHQQQSLLPRSNEIFLFFFFTSFIVFPLFVNNYLFPLVLFKA